MKKILYTVLALASASTLTGCIEETNPLTGYVTEDQAANAPNSFKGFVDAITTNLIGQFDYSPVKQYPFDYGYPSFFLQRDVMGQDIALTYSGSHYSSWAFCEAQGPEWAIPQVPVTAYYSWIKNCNTVISMYNASPSELHASGAGIAYAIRAMLYMDLARIYSQKTYIQDPDDLSAVVVTESTTDYAHNGRKTNREIWEDRIIPDLDMADDLLAGFVRDNKYVPDQSVVYGLKARAYLYMGKWDLAEQYARDAQAGYSIMTADQYLDRDNGFNTPNDSWMFGLTFRSNDPCILENDADSSWGSIMSLEIIPSGGNGCGYAANYGAQLVIDHHLYNTIPHSDFRRNCFIDFDAANLEGDALVEFLEDYSDYAEALAETPVGEDYKFGLGGFSLKFRVAGGDAGHRDQYIGFTQAVPLMRVEEMKLIEAEAAGMQNEGRGVQLLTEFALSRDPQFVYGQHNEQYYGNNSQFQNEVWWQRRVELWGEGFATFDIKRFGKGIIRSYSGTNHIEEYRWNVENTPQWMTLCIGGTDADYNYALIQNPVPVAPVGDSPEYRF